MLGGPGVIVQIDESLFKHKPKVVFVMTNLKMYLYCCSTTEVDVLNMNSGCLGWWTSLTPFPWGKCSWLTAGMLQHSFP